MASRSWTFGITLMALAIGVMTVAQGQETPKESPQTGAMTALQDSALGVAQGARALVTISTGAEGTSIRPEDLVDQAVAADIHVYPVALPSNQAIWYEGDNPILDAVKEHALARFTATYRVWFTPSPSASPRKHTLEVKLAPTSSGKVSGGKKSATY